MKTKRYSLLGTYGYICPMVFTKDLKEEIYIEPTDSYEDFLKEIKEELGIDDVSNIPVYLPYCDFHYGYKRTGDMCGTFLNPKEAFEALKKLKKKSKKSKVKPPLIYTIGGNKK